MEMAGISTDSKKIHHDLSPAAMKQEEKDVKTLTDTIRNFSNPFSNGATDLFNIVTKVVMPDAIKNDMLQQEEIGKKLLKTFVEERIQTATFGLASRKESS